MISTEKKIIMETRFVINLSRERNAFKIDESGKVKEMKT